MIKQPKRDKYEIEKIDGNTIRFQCRLDNHEIFFQAVNYKPFKDSVYISCLPTHIKWEELDELKKCIAIIEKEWRNK